jgi:hypothetical protein
MGLGFVGGGGRGGISWELGVGIRLKCILRTKVMGVRRIRDFFINTKFEHFKYTLGCYI